MANQMYPLGADHLLAAMDVDLLGDDLKAMLLDSSYSFSGTDEFAADISGFEITRSGNLTTKTFVDGVFDADDIIYPTLSGSDVAYVALFKDSGSDATSPLLVYFEITPNVVLDGSDLNLYWDVSGIFKLVP